MSARLLAVITPGDEAAALAGFAGLVTVARAAEAEVRLAYFRALPAPRVDRHDRTVADTDTEMARIASVATRALGSAARVFADVKNGDGRSLRQAPPRGPDRGRGLRATDRRPVLRRRPAVTVPRLGPPAPPGSAPILAHVGARAAAPKFEQRHGYAGTLRAAGGFWGAISGPPI